VAAPLERIRQLGARSWKPVVSLVGGALAALNALKAAGVPLGDLPVIGGTPVIKWVLVGTGVLLFVVVRFPRVAFAITRVILGPPPPPPPAGLIFRGPLPYTSDDKLPGRQKDIDACWLRLQHERLFILEGESGSGKSSFLNALLLPRARARFNVIECRIADDPFGKLRASLRNEPYRPGADVTTPQTVIEEIAKLSASTRKANGSPVDEHAKSILLCIDQFEELFATVKDETRNQVVEVLKDAIANWQLRLLVSIRSDFFDLLMRVCHSVDPKGDTLDLGNYYTLHAFHRDQADAVLDEMLIPLRGDDPLLEQQFEDFRRALIRELLRPPRDRRLSVDDEKTVLPVELQTVGMMIESSGDRYFSVAGLRRLGGKLGLLRAYIEDAKTYVWRRTAVSGEKSLLILRQLISPAQTKWAQTPQSIAMAVQLPSLQVQRVLDVFAEKYLVNPVFARDADGGDVAPSERQYELMHEHLVHILSEAPEPILQRARDAEERLRFWGERTKSAARSSEGRLARLGLFGRVLRLLRQPVPLVESLRLWRFARRGEERSMLRISLRAVLLRLTVAAALLILAWPAWEYWTRRDDYQISAVLSDVAVPIKQSYLLGGSYGQHAVWSWASSLVYTGRIDQAKDVPSDTELTGVIAAALVRAGREEDAIRLSEDKAFINDTAQELANVGEPEKALDSLIRRPAPRPYELDRSALVSIWFDRIDALIEKGETVEANKILNEMLVQQFDQIRGAISSELREREILQARALASQPVDSGFDLRQSFAYRLGAELTQAGKQDEGVNLVEGLNTLATFEILAGSAEVLFSKGLRSSTNRCVDQAVEIIRTMSTPSEGSSLYRLYGVDTRSAFVVARGLALAGRIEDARLVLNAAGIAHYLPDLVDEISQELEAVGKYKEARDLLGYPNYLVSAVDKVVNGGLEDALIYAKSAHDSTPFFRAIISELVREGRTDEALTIVPNIPHDYDRFYALHDVAENRAKRGLIAEAIKAANDGQDGTERSKIYGAIALEVISSSRGKSASLNYGDALPLIPKISDYAIRSLVSSLLAAELTNAHEYTEAKKLLDESYDIAPRIRDDRSQSKAYTLIAQSFAALKLYRKARDAANRCSSPVDKLEAYSSIVREFATAHQPILKSRLDKLKLKANRKDQYWRFVEELCR